MRDFEDSTLWRISAFERMRLQTGTSGFQRLDGPTVLPTTLLADLTRLERDPSAFDALEVVAACVRHREAALLCLQHDGLVWPVTLFPVEGLYHSPRDLAGASLTGLAQLTVLTTEPPGVRAPGHWMPERVAAAEQYHPLTPLLWNLAMHGPRRSLLAEIGGTAAYRVAADRSTGHPVATGALGSAIERLTQESSALRQVAAWPGMTLERASRLLNALYLASNLIVTRSHPAARPEPGAGRGFFGFGRKR